MTALVALVLQPQVLFAGSFVTTVIVIGPQLREWFGRRRGEPPGNRSVILGIRDLAHRDAIQRRFDRYGPVTVSSQFGRTVVLVQGLSRGHQLLRDEVTTIGPSKLPFTQHMMGDFLRYMDNPTHDLYGKLVRRSMSREVTDAASQLVSSQMIDELGVIGPEPVVAHPLLHRVAERTLWGALLGVDPTEPEFSNVIETSNRFTRRAIHHRLHRAARHDLDALRTFVQERATIADASVCALSEMKRIDPNMPDAVAIDNLLFMLRIGATNTAGLMTWATQFLAIESDLKVRLADGEEGLAEAMVMETLRLAQSEYVYRRVTSDMTLDGLRLRQGWLVRLCVAEAHRDPAAFPHPEDFTDRFLRSRPSQDTYSPFGFGRHACNAGGIATAIVVATLRALASDSSLQISPAQSVTREFRHWSHWRPTDDLTFIRTNARD